MRDLGSIQLLAEMLPARVGSPLSLNGLREDLELSQSAVTHHLSHFKEKLKIPFAYSVALDPASFHESGGVIYVPAGRFLSALGV